MFYSKSEPYRAAIASNRVKALLPTSLGSRELAALEPEFRRQAFFSARVENARILAGFQELVGRVLANELDQAQFRVAARELLDDAGYQADPKDLGTIKDLRSQKRLDVIVETNVDMARGYADYLNDQDPDVLDAFPAQEFLRVEERIEKRNWLQRWRGIFGKLFGGQMIARKDDARWTELNAFGNRWRPWDWNSGMGTRNVSREEAEGLGVLGALDFVEPQIVEFGRNPEATFASDDPAMRQALLDSLGEGYEFRRGEVGFFRRIFNRLTGRRAGEEEVLARSGEVSR